MSCGIYKITNKINGHSYIGLSKNIENRFKDHKSKAFNSNKKDDLDKVLYKAFRKYGLDNFNFDIIELCEEDKLKEREIFWIKYYNTYLDRNHYNETPGGDTSGIKNIKIGENHGMSILKEKDVLYCRQCYKEGKRSKDIWEKFYKNKIGYTSFQKMWHGTTWKHVMPEVFKINPNPKKKYNKEDCEKINKMFKDSNLSLNAFQKTKECYVGYGTLYKMIHNPEFYK